jgi:hypothetical protein
MSRESLFRHKTKIYEDTGSPAGAPRRMKLVVLPLKGTLIVAVLMQEITIGLTCMLPILD